MAWRPVVVNAFMELKRHFLIVVALEAFWRSSLAHQGPWDSADTRLEPCIQGHNGSGSVFFSGCNLRCVFCQNHEIAHQRNGFDVTPEELAGWYLKLQDVGQVHK